MAIGLAQAIALSGRPVILVELDLRHPSLARTFGLADQGGVTNALLGSEPERPAAAPDRELPDLEVLAAGVLPPEPGRAARGARARRDAAQPARRTARRRS